jgi:hypothetical protein
LATLRLCKTFAPLREKPFEHCKQKTSRKDAKKNAKAQNSLATLRLCETFAPLRENPFEHCKQKTSRKTRRKRKGAKTLWPLCVFAKPLRLCVKTLVPKL